MLTSSDLTQFANVCTSISNDVADKNGFVSVRRLLDRFSAKLVVTPLLVEGMLAEAGNAETTAIQNSYRWIVLIDSDRYPISDLDVEKEQWGKPLQVRSRFTIAHELTHTLAFTSTEFGIRLKNFSLNNKKSQEELIKNIERETDKLSSLLLWSEESIAGLVIGRENNMTVHELAGVCKNIGISRHALINRLNFLKRHDPRELTQRPGLKNLAVGLGKWVNSKKAVLTKWPLYCNFENNVLPEFLLKLRKQDNVPISSLYSEENYSLGKKDMNELSFETEARTQDSPKKETMSVHFSMESTEKKSGTDFLFTVSKSY